MEESVTDMSKALSKYFEEASTRKEKQPEYKFPYIWQNLDNLFQQLPQSDVNDLNLEFMSQTMARINKNK